MSKIIRAICVLLLLSASAFAGPWLGLIYKKSLYENHLALLVSGVHPESGCLSAGIVSGDLVIGFDGKDLVNVAQIQDVLKKAKVGSKVAIEIFRDGKRIPLKVTLTERPDDISSLTGSAIGSKMAEFGKNFYKNGEKRKDAPKATLLDFWATWCGPCKKVAPLVEELASEYEGQAIVGKVNVEDEDDLASQFGIRNIPTILFIKNGEVVDKQVGACPKSVLEDKLKALL
jgi:thioredoxin